MSDSQFDRSIRTVAGSSLSSRRERDSLGEVDVPADAYWGVNTARALANFSISGRPISEFPDLLVAFAQVKQAAARANLEVGTLPADRAALIDEACSEIVAGGLHEQFVVDVIQGGAGTSTNMNVNEVIANRGLELAGHGRGAYEHLSPNDDVNCAQSTNDCYSTAMKLALHMSLVRLLAEMSQLEVSLTAKAREFHTLIKWAEPSYRTQCR